MVGFRREVVPARGVDGPSPTNGAGAIYLTRVPRGIPVRHPLPHRLSLHRPSRHRLSLHWPSLNGLLRRRLSLRRALPRRLSPTRGPLERSTAHQWSGHRLPGLRMRRDHPVPVRPTVPSRHHLRFRGPCSDPERTRSQDGAGLALAGIIVGFGLIGLFILVIILLAISTRRTKPVGSGAMNGSNNRRGRR